MNVLEIPEALPTTTAPRTIDLPSTRGDDALRKMIELARKGRWTRGSYVDGDGRRCTIGMVHYLGG